MYICNIEVLKDHIFHFVLYDFVKFADRISFNRFGGDSDKENELKYLYKHILIYSFLKNIFTTKVQFNKCAKKSDLIGNHVFEKTKAKQLIQKYVKNKPNASLFPSHRKAAIDYFEVCFLICVIFGQSIFCYPNFPDV